MYSDNTSGVGEKKLKTIFLSYVLDKSTPTYGDRNKFNQIKQSDISQGDVANDTVISTTVHIGTHIDMPYHFYENGQTIVDFDADFWICTNPLFVEINQRDLIIAEQLVEKLNAIEDIGYDILIVKTGICHKRETKDFWYANYGFHKNIYDVLISKFPNIKIFGFDSISVSSFQNREMGREAHKRFLNPARPILLLEDMDLRDLGVDTQLKEVVIAPLRIDMCDGLPCTVFGVVDD